MRGEEDWRGLTEKKKPNKKFLFVFSFRFGGGLESFEDYAFPRLRIPRDLNLVFSVRESVPHCAFWEIFPAHIIRVGNCICEGIGETAPDFFKRLFTVFVPGCAPLAVAEGVHCSCLGVGGQRIHVKFSPEGREDSTTAKI